MARDRLVGDYGKVVQAVYGSEVIAAGTLTSGTWYLITGVDGSSPAFNGSPEVGYLYRGGGETLATDDKALPLTETDLCDIQGWSLSSEKGEIDVTSLCDDVTVYKLGKSDVSGSLTGVYTIGTTNIDDGIQNGFVDIVKQASSTYTISKINNSSIFVKLYTQKDTTSGETESFYYAPVVLNSFEHNVAQGEGQTFTSGFRITTDPTNNTKYQYVEYTHS